MILPVRTHFPFLSISLSLSLFLSGSLSPCGTPTPTGGGAEKGVSMVALERYRQQTNVLQRELVDKKEELAEQASIFDKKREELDAEVAALTKTNRVRLDWFGASTQPLVSFRNAQ